MEVFTKIAAVCAATTMLAGAASAADMPSATPGRYTAAPHYSTGYRHSHVGAFGGYGYYARHHGSLLGLGHRSSAYGRAKQRHRTRLDRCNNVPSRC